MATATKKSAPSASSVPAQASADRPMDESTLQRKLRIEGAQSWRPEQGETLTGTLVTLKKGESEYGAYPIVIIEDSKDGEFRAVHAFHTLVRERLAALRPKPGDLVTIHYVGSMETNASKKTFAAGGAEKDRTYYHNYVVILGDGTEEDTADSWTWDEDTSPSA